MISEEITRIIYEEIGDDWQYSNAHGIDLRKCLVTPQKRRFLTNLDSGSEEEFWLVLEEFPANGSGYKIIFDEESKMFGLATAMKESKRDFFLGIYGSFLETLEGM